MPTFKPKSIRRPQGQQATRQVGYATRIYKNDCGEILAIDDIAVVADIFCIDKGDTSFFNRAGYFTSKRTKLNLSPGNREIDFIQMIGDYDEITEDLVSGCCGCPDNGNFLTATWKCQNPDDTNDITVSFFRLLKIGDTV